LGEDLIGLLESGEQSWVDATLRFIGRALVRILAVGDQGGVLRSWSDGGMLDCLERMAEGDVKIDVIAVRFRSAANFVF
jgi:hypothetical protein